MIQYLKGEAIDRQKWDACIEAAFNGVVYANSWYLDIVSQNWDGLVEDDYDRIFPLITGRKWGINYLYQPVFTQQLGIISKSILTEEIVNNFIQAIPGKFKFAEINLNKFNKITQINIEVQYWQNFELDLIRDYGTIYKNYSENLRRNLKKSEKAELTLLKNTKPEEIITLFRENRGKQITNSNEDDYERLNRLAYAGIYKGLIGTYGIYSPRNELCAGAIILKGKNRVIFLFSGLSDEGKETGAMAKLIDSVIKEHAQQQITFDFEGSNDPSLARFYKSFGSSSITYPHIVMNRLPLIMRIPVLIAKEFLK